MSLAVIVPDLSGVHLFATNDVHLRHEGHFSMTNCLVAALANLNPRPAVVVSAGPVEPEPYDQILNFADILVIPEVWLHPIPKHATRSRARLAVRIHDADSTQRIERLFSRAYPDPIPF